MEVVLYSTDCPKCKVLEKKLNNIGIQYSIIKGEESIIEKGFSSAPLLEVDGEIMDFMKANNWIKEQE